MRSVQLEPGSVQLWLLPPVQVLALGGAGGRQWAARTLVAHAMGLAPEDLRIARDGRPRVAWPAKAPEFSVSHSQGWMLLGICQGEGLGVDLEVLDRRMDPSAVWRRHFNARESEFLDALPQEQGLAEFLRLWTRKEALLKLSGLGLQALDSLKEGAGGAWMEELVLPAGMAGALAMARAPWQVRLNVLHGPEEMLQLEVA